MWTVRSRLELVNARRVRVRNRIDVGDLFKEGIAMVFMVKQLGLPTVLHLH
jgi:hypothetical protein